MASKATLNLSENDMRVIALALQCTSDGEFPKVDHAKLAELGGWANANSAKTALSNAKKHLKDATVTMTEGDNDKKTTTKASGKKRGKNDDEAAGDDEESPKKKGRGGGRGKKTAAKEDPPMKDDEAAVETEDAEDPMDPEARAPKKKPGRKPKATKATAGAESEDAVGEEITVQAEENGDAMKVEAPAAKKKPGRKPKTVKAGADGEEGADTEPVKAAPKPRGRPPKKGGKKTPSAASRDEGEGTEAAAAGETLETVQEEVANGEGEMQEAMGADGA